MIPKVIHRAWSGPRPIELTWVDRVTRNLHPDWEIVDHPLDPLMSGRVCPGDEIRHGSNWLRYRVLADRGGVWLDWDVVLLRPLDPLRDRAFAAALYGRLEGCVLGSPPGGPVFSQLASTVEALPRVGGGLPSAGVSGADLLDRVGRPRLRSVPEFVPFDALGRSTGVVAWGVHGWATSSLRPLR